MAAYFGMYFHAQLLQVGHYKFSRMYFLVGKFRVLMEVSSPLDDMRQKGIRLLGDEFGDVLGPKGSREAEDKQ
jgi:hypothetical protein